MRRKGAFFKQIVLGHVLAGAAGLYFAWVISGTPLMTTGVQFVAPMIVVLCVHTCWLLASGTRLAGQVQRLLARATQTAGLMVAGLLLFAILAPMPNHAQDWGPFGNDITMIVVCALMIAVVVLVVGGLLYGIFFLIWKAIKHRGENDRLNGGVGLAVILSVLGAISLEGVPGAYTFSGSARASAEVEIDATPEAVWATMQTATSPVYPLPQLFTLLPRPVAVTVDEGTTLGANRVVHFSGREGMGDLHLRVTEADPNLARFTVQSDTTPLAGWITFRHLTYRLSPGPDGTTRLTTSLDFERALAPAWFFEPVMRGTGALSMAVLAKDTKARAEGRAP